MDSVTENRLDCSLEIIRVSAPAHLSLDAQDLAVQTL